MTIKPLNEWTTVEIEERLESAAGFPSAADLAEAKRILRERRAEPDRTIQRWILAVATAALVITLLHFFYDLAYQSR